jgi:two-component system response regulator PilR (NtrC family)
MNARSTPYVLVIDDEDTYRSILLMLLEDQGYAAAEASTLAEARALVAEPRRIDIVLLDASLPDGRGLSLVPEIRAAHPAAKIVLLSGSGTAEFDAGNEDLAARILKGGDPEDLLLLLRSFLST